MLSLIHVVTFSLFEVKESMDTIWHPRESGWNIAKENAVVEHTRSYDATSCRTQAVGECGKRIFIGNVYLIPIVI
jgi:hypothetical protein